MEKNELIGRITVHVEEYCAQPEGWDDDAQLRIDAETLGVGIVDGEMADLAEGRGDTEFDFYPMMDLVTMDPSGVWHPDTDAIESLASEYIQ